MKPTSRSLLGVLCEAEKEMRLAVEELSDLALPRPNRSVLLELKNELEHVKNLNRFQCL